MRIGSLKYFRIAGTGNLNKKPEAKKFQIKTLGPLSPLLTQTAELCPAHSSTRLCIKLLGVVRCCVAGCGEEGGGVCLGWADGGGLCKSGD
jgi:hypothetical protein